MPKMTRKPKLPQINGEGLAFSPRSDVLEKWSPSIKAADNSISILQPIGEAIDGSGVTARRIGAALRTMRGGDVTVDINSPGGDFFEGVAIYNMLAEHPGNVTVRVLGMAASAASVIAMAGDRIEMGRGAFFMVHNAWAVALGNKNDMLEAAAMLEPFDEAMVQLYSERTGLDASAVREMMDAETWLDADAAMESGFADAMIGDDIEEEKDDDYYSAKALAIVEGAMASAGYTRKFRREILKDFNANKPGAVGGVKPGAGVSVETFIETLRNANNG